MSTQLATESMERVVKTRGGQVRSRLLSGGDGPSLLYLHGVFGLAPDPFLEGLKQHFTVHAPENPGGGEFDDLDHLHGVWDLVQHYDDLLDALGLDTVHVVGHSFGGMVAAELAANSPHRVERLTLISPLGLWREDLMPVPEWWASTPEEFAAMMLGSPDAVPQAAAALFATPDDPIAKMRRSFMSASVNHYMWPLPDKGLERRLYRIAAPTLVLWGGADRFSDPRYAPLFLNGLKDARAELVDGAGHLVTLEQTARCLERVRAFHLGPEAC